MHCFSILRTARRDDSTAWICKTRSNMSDMERGSTTDNSEHAPLVHHVVHPWVEFAVPRNEFIASIYFSFGRIALRTPKRTLLTPERQRLYMSSLFTMGREFVECNAGFPPGVVFKRSYETQAMSTTSTRPLRHLAATGQWERERRVRAD